MVHALESIGEDTSRGQGDTSNYVQQRGYKKH